MSTNNIKNKINWQQQASKLLQDACTPWGIKASLTNRDNYGAVFTRDAVMAGVVGLLMNDKVIIEGFKNTVHYLKTLQGQHGQIASNFKVEAGKIQDVSFGTLSPKIDSCTWYMVGVGLLLKKGIIKKGDYQESIEKVIGLLDALEYNGKNLIYIPKGGNWADEYVYEGYVLSDQLLRTWGLSLLSEQYENSEWAAKSTSILASVKKKYKDENSEYLFSSIYPGGEFKQFDLAAHALAGIVFSKDDFFVEQSLDWVVKHFIKNEILPPAFYPTINEGDADWSSLRAYHLFDFKNKPHHYHNGGIWWIWLGWLSVALSLHKKNNANGQLIDIVFKQLDALEDFNFEEYLSADTKQPHGTEKLCYSATGILFLSLAKTSFDFSCLRIEGPSLFKEPIELKKNYFDVSNGIIEQLVTKSLLQKEKLVIGICGESGSGKSVTARCLQIELEKRNIQSLILHQDGYYKLLPSENQAKRKADIGWVGVNEVRMDLMQQHVNDFKNGHDFINLPVVDYEKDSFEEYPINLRNKTVLIVEGVYSFCLRDFDYKIFMSRTYKETMAKRKERKREVYDPFVEEVLAIEHPIVLELGTQSDLTVSKEYKIT